METYSRTARFILSCNYFSKLIDPIKSRCAVFKFKPYNPEQIKELIEKISQKEGFKINNETKTLLAEISKGDLRKIENILQTASTTTKNIDANHILQTESKAEQLLLQIHYILI